MNVTFNESTVVELYVSETVMVAVPETVEARVAVAELAMTGTTIELCGVIALELAALHCPWLVVNVTLT